MRLQQCHHCDEFFETYDLEYHNGIGLCRICQPQYFLCERCGNWILITERRVIYGRRVCISCAPYIEPPPRGTHVPLGYGNPPYEYLALDDDPVRRRKYLGVELEVDNGAMAPCVSELRKIPNIWMKHDGSLSSWGIEIVTHPATFNYHKSEMRWKDILNICDKHGYHGAECCGLHIHVNRGFFGRYNGTKYKQRVGKLLYMTNNMWKEMERFSRRSACRIDRWARRPVDIAKSDDMLIESGVMYDKCKGTNGGKGRAINIFADDNTIEFRLFGSTTKYNELFAALEFTDLMTNLAVELSVLDVSNMSWARLLSHAREHGYDHIVSYCEEKGGILCPT